MIRRRDESFIDSNEKMMTIVMIKVILKDNHQMGHCPPIIMMIRYSSYIVDMLASPFPQHESKRTLLQIRYNILRRALS